MSSHPETPGYFADDVTNIQFLAGLVTHYAVLPYFLLRHSIEEVLPHFQASPVLP
jgi:hypothetical protein